MPNIENEISDSGIAATSGLEVYMTITIDSVDYLIDIVANDKFGNSHKVLRRAINDTIEEN